MKTLNDSYLNTLLDTKYGDKGTVHSYIQVYQKYVEKFKNRCTLLELGVGYGESLRMWEDYFDTGYIIGVQLPSPNDKFLRIVEDYNLNVIYGNATDPELAFILSNIKFNIIVDDASHKLDDQIKSFNNLFHLVEDGGYYIIEDIEDIDYSRSIFEKLHKNCTVYDMREEKDRFDNVMVVYEK